MISRHRIQVLYPKLWDISKGFRIRNSFKQWSHPFPRFGQNLQAWTPAYEHVSFPSGSHISPWINPRRSHGSPSIVNTILFIRIVTLYPVTLTALLLKLNKSGCCWFEVVNTLRGWNNLIATIVTGSSLLSSSSHLFYYLSHHVSEK